MLEASASLSYDLTFISSIVIKFWRLIILLFTDSSVDSSFDEHDIPYDVLWLDIEHTDGKKYMTWDKLKFPSPEQMQKNLAAKGRKVLALSTVTARKHVIEVLTLTSLLSPNFINCFSRLRESFYALYSISLWR